MATEVVRRQLRNSYTGGAAEQTHRHLPEEIIEEILPKLPVKSLLRFKCVSKSWRCLISSKSFLKTHLEKSKKNESFAHHRIISPTPKSLDDFSVHSLLSEPVTHAISYPFMDNSTESVIVGCCNGLICVLVDRCRFLLWNPSTKECKELPDFCRNLKYLRECSLISMHGFGFDESSGDYKIFAVFYSFNFSDTSPHMRRVYSLKADSWIGDESFKNGSPLDDVRGDLAGKFANGNLHWMINREWELKWEIVFFDLKSETFGLVEQPSCMEGHDRPKLGVLKECLCVFFDCPQTFGFDIWIWKEYGVEESWSKLLTISCVSQISWNHSLVKSLNHVRPLLVLQRDEVLFRYGSVFYIYNAKDDWVRQLHIDNIGDISHFCEAEAYVESLVSLNSLKRDDDDQQA